MNKKTPTKKPTAESTPVAQETTKGPNSKAPNPKVRLQRALAAAGYGSRRQCEDLIVEGRILVDGKIVTELGVTVEPGAQKIFVDGTPLKPRRLVYYALNKPTGVVTTNVDPEGRPRVIDLVPPDERVFPVGRLDRSSEGLILLTNDGDLAQRLAHPSYEISKVYRVTVAGRIDVETLKQMERGIHIAEGLVKVEGARVMKIRGRATELEITLKEGKNREIRRILARLGHKVQQLKRIAIGPLRLGEMPTGAYRQLGFEELKKLKASVEASTSGAKRSVRVGGSESGRKGVRVTGRKRDGETRRVGERETKRVGEREKGRGGDGTGKKFVKKVAVGSIDGKRTPLKRKTVSAKGAIEISVDRVTTGSVIGADPVPVKVARKETRKPVRVNEDRIVRRKKAAPKTANDKRSFGRGAKRSRRKDE